MSFNIGDKVICISKGRRYIIIGHIYTITLIGPSNRLNLIRDGISYYGFDSKYFMLLKEYRKIKLQSIIENI